MKSTVAAPALGQAGVTSGIIDRKHKLTATLCAKLLGPPPGSSAKEIEFSDTEVSRLKFYVTPQKRGWRYRYQVDDLKKSIRIGDFPGISVEEARRTAREFGAALDRGEDPEHPREAAKGFPTFEAFALTEYLTYANQHKKSACEDESKLRLHMLPEFGKRKINAISRYDIELYRSKIAKSHCNATSNRHLALLSRIYALAIHWDRVDRSPCSGIKKLTESTEVGREFKKPEISALIAALDQEPNQQAATALRFLMFTGLRLREVLDLEWDRVDLAESRIYLNKTKAGKPRHVVLNSIALDLIREIKRPPNSPYVFPSQKDPKKPLHNIQKAWRRVLNVAGIGHARIHDLRHHFCSAGVRAGLPLHSIGKLVGHAPGSNVTQRYAHLADDVMRKDSEKTAEALLAAMIN